MYILHKLDHKMDNNCGIRWFIISILELMCAFFINVMPS